MPPADVLAAWGVDDPVPLAGGQGSTFLCGALVLKPVLDDAETTWLASALGTLPHRADLRIIRPVPARAGQWVVAGWSAWEHLDGEHQAGRWRDVLQIADRFHRAVGKVKWSEALNRTHPWARGDAFAWSDYDISIPAALMDLVTELRGRERHVELPSQLIHGDLTNNVLFHDELPPAVIDVSPFWRPARYAKAIVVADMIGWFGVGDEALEPLADPEGVQLLTRAILFRLGSAVLLFPDDPGRLGAEVDAYRRLVTMLPT